MSSNRFGLVGGLKTTHEFDVEGRVRRVTATGSSGFYNSGVGTSWYDLNEAGEMTHKVAAEMPFADAPDETWSVLDKSQK